VRKREPSAPAVEESKVEKRERGVAEENEWLRIWWKR
jgi:hypothetical protein